MNLTPKNSKGLLLASVFNTGWNYSYYEYFLSSAKLMGALETLTAEHCLNHKIEVECLDKHFQFMQTSYVRYGNRTPINPTVWGKLVYILFPFGHLKETPWESSLFLTWGWSTRSNHVAVLSKQHHGKPCITTSNVCICMQCCVIHIKGAKFAFWCFYHLSTRPLWILI